MYDIQALEEEWKKYKHKKKRPLYLLISFFAMLIIFGFLFSTKKVSSFPEASETLDTNKSDSISEKVFVLLDDKISELQVLSENKMNNKVVEPKVKSNKIDIPMLPVVDNIPVIDEAPIGKIIVSEQQTMKPKIDIQVSERPHKKIHLNIIESSSTSAYKDVEKRFKQSHDTDDSLFLAKSYYRKGNYIKAEYWALQTNKINSSLEESWLIYVKSKAKLGHKNEAISILTNYAKRSNSAAAWNLLLQLKK